MVAGDNMTTKRLTFLAMLLALSVILNIVERIIMGAVSQPLVFIVPPGGIRIGLANIVILIILYTYGIKDALAMLILRVLLVGIVTGSLGNVAFFNSVVGGLLAFTMMVTFKHLPGFSIISVSIMGAVGHVFGQIIVTTFIVGLAAVFYLPFMLIFTIPAGLFTAKIARMMISYLKPIMENSSSLKY